MTPDRIDFFVDNVQLLENKLLGLPLSELFTGELYEARAESVSQAPAELLRGLILEGFGEGVMRLEPVDIGRLFMALDGSLVQILRLPEQADGTPAGVNVTSDNSFVQDGELTTVVAYQDEEGPAVRVDALRMRRIVLDQGAPARLATVAFGLMTCTAYRFGFREITLFAGGHGHQGRILGQDDLVGFMVWPKFGFDALLIPADTNGEPRLAHCRSVLDVVERDAAWWNAHGRGVEMKFDLTPGSRSWQVLLNYVFKVFAEE